MNYEKLTLAAFSTNLQDGKYASATGARRAVGKADWTEKDKTKGRALVDEFFGTADAPAAKPKEAKKASAAPKAAKESTEPKKKPGRPKGSTNKVKAGAQPKARVEETTDGDLTVLDVPLSFNKTVEIANTAAASLQAMAQAKQANSRIELPDLQTAVNILTHALETLDGYLPKKDEAKAVAEEEEDAASSYAPNGKGSHVSEEEETGWAADHS